MMNAIPEMTEPLGRYWRQPADIREAPMDDLHVLLTAQQFDGLPEYSSTYPSGTYDGKCWKRQGDVEWYLCWYRPHSQPGKIGIGFRTILEVNAEALPSAVDNLESVRQGLRQALIAAREAKK
jgi:uncharacterized protein (DUF3820 family)